MTIETTPAAQALLDADAGFPTTRAIAQAARTIGDRPRTLTFHGEGDAAIVAQVKGDRVLIDAQQQPESSEQSSGYARAAAPLAAGRHY